jgi:hypothetical protein
MPSRSGLAVEGSCMVAVMTTSSITISPLLRHRTRRQGRSSRLPGTNVTGVPPRDQGEGPWAPEPVIYVSSGPLCAPAR